MPLDYVVTKAFQRYWRLSRALTLGAQGMVFDADGRLLLVRHGYRPGWHFPGGGVEKSETAAAALERELDEEAGIALTGPAVLFGLYANFKMFPGDHIALFRVPHWRQDRRPKPSVEIVETGFFARDALPEGTSASVHRRIAELLGDAACAETW